jgi:hypothetical protein
MSARKHDDAQSEHDDAQTRARRREHLASQVLHRSCRCNNLTQTPTVNTAHHTTHTIPPIQAIQARPARSSPQHDGRRCDKPQAKAHPNSNPGNTGTTRKVVAATRWSSPRQAVSQSASQPQSRQHRHDPQGRRRNTMVVAATSRKPKRIPPPYRQIPRHDLHGRRRNMMVVAATSRKPKRISIQAIPRHDPHGRRRNKSQATARRRSHTRPTQDPNSRPPRHTISSPRRTISTMSRSIFHDDTTHGRVTESTMHETPFPPESGKTTGQARALRSLSGIITD